MIVSPSGSNNQKIITLPRQPVLTRSNTSLAAHRAQPERHFAFCLLAVGYCGEMEQRMHAADLYTPESLKTLCHCSIRSVSFSSSLSRYPGYPQFVVVVASLHSCPCTSRAALLLHARPVGTCILLLAPYTINHTPLFLPSRTS